MKAAILTAGRATQLSPHTDDVARTLLPVAGVPILRRTIGTLLRYGVDELVIGTGYRGEMVEDAVATWYPELDVTFVENPAWATTGNARSLALLAPALDGQAFLLFDDDVVFDAAVLDRLLERGLDALAVRSVGRFAADDVKVHADAADRVTAIGVDLPAKGAMGESIGIAAFSGATSTALFQALDRCGPGALYEAAFQAVIDGGAEIIAVDLGSAYAIGIDTYGDLCAANARLAG